MTDLESPYIIVPSAFYTQVVQELASLGLPCNIGTYDSNEIGAACSNSSNINLDSLPPLNITFSSSYSISINASKYITSSMNNLYLLIVPSSNVIGSPGSFYVTASYLNAVILGQPVFLSYYVIYDFTSTLAPTVRFYQQTGNNNNNNNNSNIDGGSDTTIVIIVVGSLIGAIVVGLILSYCFCRKKISSYRAFRFMQPKSESTEALNANSQPDDKGQNYFRAPEYNNSN